MVRVDEAYLQPARFEDLEKRDPEHAGLAFSCSSVLTNSTVE